MSDDPPKLRSVPTTQQRHRLPPAPPGCVVERSSTLTEERVAVFSRCAPEPRWRYYLEIVWDRSKPLLVGFLLNPSKATHLINDPTVARMCTRAAKRGFGGVIILNAFAWRETDRIKMLSVTDPIGPGNDEVIRRTLRDAVDFGWTVMVGWGNEGGHRGRSDDIVRLLEAESVRAVCLRYCANGQPGHPLYLPYDQEFMPWPKRFGS